MPDILCLDCGARFHHPLGRDEAPPTAEAVAGHYEGCASRTALDGALLERLARRDD